MFARSASFAGIIDSNGFVRYDASIHSSEIDVAKVGSQGAVVAEISTKPVDEPLAVTAPTMTRFPRKVKAPPIGYSQWLFPIEGTYIRLETPEKMTKAVWEK